MKKILGIGLGTGIGIVIYDYLSQGVIDWKRAIIIAIIASILFLLVEKIKK